MEGLSEITLLRSPESMTRDYLKSSLSNGRRAVMENQYHQNQPINYVDNFPNLKYVIAYDFSFIICVLYSN